VIQDQQGCGDLEFAWNDAPTVDPAAQAQIDDVSLRNGSATIDEVRGRRGLPPLPGGLGAQARIYGGQGAVPLQNSPPSGTPDDANASVRVLNSSAGPPPRHPTAA
jgi:hypothetical protein